MYMSFSLIHGVGVKPSWGWIVCHLALVVGVGSKALYWIQDLGAVSCNKVCTFGIKCLM